MNEELIMTSPDYTAEITTLLHSNLTPGRMRERLFDYHERDVATALETMPAEERRRVCRLLEDEALAGILEYVEDPDDCLAGLSLRRRGAVLSCMEAAVAAEYLTHLDEDSRDTLLALMDSEQREEVALLTSFDKDTVGSRMTTNYISVQKGLDVRGIMRELVEQAAENDNVSTVYMVDRHGALLGAIDLKDLIRARAGDPVEPILMTSYPYVYAAEPLEDCIERLKEYSEDSIPVLDAQNRLCGVVTAQDLAEIIDDEIGEDYAKLAGLSSEEDLREPLIKSVGKRLPWLILLFGLGLLVSGVVGLFEAVVAELTLIVSFQSLILGMAGNVGTQSLAVTIRSLSDERLTGRETLRLVTKEARISLCNGICLGTLSFGLVGCYLWLLRGETPATAFLISLCTGLALLVAMFLSGISGSAIPLLLKKLKVDPAVASGPFITTVNDLVAVVTYYGLAWALLIGAVG